MDRNEAQQKLADELVATKREQKYGHPKDNYRRIAHIWSAVLGIEVTPVQAVLCELGVKFSRLIQTPDDEDTQVDVHGYIKVLQRLLDPDDKPFVAAKDYKVSWHRTVADHPEMFTDAYGRVWVPRDEPVVDKPYITWGSGGTQKAEALGNYQLVDEPTAFTADPHEELLAKKAELYKSGSREYGDGSKEMTFEEACGERATERRPKPHGMSWTEHTFHNCEDEGCARKREVEDEMLAQGRTGNYGRNPRGQ